MKLNKVTLVSLGSLTLAGFFAVDFTEATDKKESEIRKKLTNLTQDSQPKNHDGDSVLVDKIDSQDKDLKGTLDKDDDEDKEQEEVEEEDEYKEEDEEEDEDEDEQRGFN